MPIIKCLCLDNARVVITNVCRRTVHIRKGAGEQKRAYNLCHKNSSGKCDIANKELYTNTLFSAENTQVKLRQHSLQLEKWKLRGVWVYICVCVCVQEQKFCLLHSFFYIIFYLFGIFSPPTFFYPLNNTEHGNKRRGMQTGWKDEGYGSTMASPKIS